MIPERLTERLRGTRHHKETLLAISGSRRPDPQTAAACGELLHILLDLRRERMVRVLVGDADGIDAITRARIRDAQVYRAESREARHLVSRSLLMVSDLDMFRMARVTNALLLGFPSKACPSSILPVNRWVPGCRDDGQRDVSGTWSTLGVAAGKGIPVAVYLTEQRLAAPTTGAWNFRYLGGGWWLHEEARPV